MKQVKLLVIVFFLFISSAMAQDSYSIKLEMTGFKEGTEFKLVNLDLGKTIDSAKLKNGVSLIC